MTSGSYRTKEQKGGRKILLKFKFIHFLLMIIEKEQDFPKIFICDNKMFPELFRT